MKISYAALNLGAGVAISIAAIPVAAQNTSNTPIAEEIIVQGQHILESRSQIGSRLGLSIRETPAIVDVLTQDDLQLQGVRTALEAMNAAPGLHSGNLPGSVGAASMRGFHRAINYLHDGVRIANSDVMVRNWDSWSFERIEVLKGPASVTSGEGALAGAVNFVPRRPHQEGVSSELLLSQGSHDTFRLGVDHNRPLSETAALRTTASYSKSAGWIDDTDSSALAAGLALLLEPNDRLDVTLSLDYAEDDFSTAYYGTPLIPRAVAIDPSNAVSSSSDLVLDKSMRKVNFANNDGIMDSSSLWSRLKAEYQVSDNITVVSDTSWYDSDRLWRDADTFSFNNSNGLITRGTSLISHDHQFWNQRIHLAFDGAINNHRNRFIVGFEAGGTDFFTVRRFGSAAAVNPWQPQRGFFPADTPQNFATRQNISADVKSQAFFVENAFNLTADWLMVAGLRYDSIELDRHITDMTSGAQSNYGQDYDPITWRFGTVYNLRPQTQLFAQYTRAVTPVSAFLFMSAANASYDLTTGESWEAGLRHSFADNRLHLTSSVFHIRQDDILTRDPVTPTIVYQGGSQISRGVELALNWLPLDELAVSLSGTLLNAEFENLLEAGAVDRSGNRPTNVPEQLADLSVTYSPAALPISFTGIVRHNGDFYTANANTIKVNGHTVFDAAINWPTSVGTFTLRGRNLTDEFYADWSGYSADMVFVAAPRSAELTFSRKF